MINGNPDPVSPKSTSHYHGATSGLWAGGKLVAPIEDDTEGEVNIEDVEEEPAKFKKCPGVGSVQISKHTDISVLEMCKIAVS